MDLNQVVVLSEKLLSGLLIYWHKKWPTNINTKYKQLCRSTPNVWGYFSVRGGGSLHEFADSQFGHIFARGETREQVK